MGTESTKNHSKRVVKIIDVKNVFLSVLLFKKRVFNVFNFLEGFLFSSAEYFHPTKPAKILLNRLNSCIKRLLSDGFNTVTIKNSLMKSHRRQ